MTGRSPQRKTRVMNWVSPIRLLTVASLTVLALVGALAAASYVVLAQEAEARALDAAYNNLNEMKAGSVEKTQRTVAASLKAYRPTSNDTSAVAAFGENVNWGKSRVLPEPLDNRPPRTLLYRVNGARAYGFWLPLGKNQWFFIGELVGPYYASVYRILIAIALSGLLVASGLASLGMLAQRRLRHQLLSISEACAKIGSGDLGHRLDETLSSPELRGIAIHVNSMVCRLEGKVQDLRILSRAVAHDMRNYIVYARIQLQKLQREPSSKNRELVSRSVAAMALLDQVTVEIAKVSNERANWNFTSQSHNLGETALRTAALFRDSCEDAGVQLALKADDALVNASSSLIIGIANNLMANALKYASCGGLITISTYQDVHSSYLEVSDLGPGIPRAHREDIFQLEHRLPRDMKVDGYGYGLSIARLLTRLTGGQIKVVDTRECDEAPGARFVVRFPRLVSGN